MMGDGPPAVIEAPTWQPPEHYANDNEMDLYVEPEPEDQPLEDTLVIEPEEEQMPEEEQEEEQELKQEEEPEEEQPEQQQQEELVENRAEQEDEADEEDEEGDDDEPFMVMQEAPSAVLGAAATPKQLMKPATEPVRLEMTLDRDFGQLAEPAEYAEFKVQFEASLTAALEKSCGSGVQVVLGAVRAGSVVCDFVVYAEQMGQVRLCSQAVVD